MPVFLTGYLPELIHVIHSDFINFHNSKRHLAGIYIHIPFCRKACRYCNFHFRVALGQSADMVQCIVLEIQKRKDELDQEKIETIYFGGGTPSVLRTKEISDILGAVYSSHEISKYPEITIEANPDDLEPEYIKELKDHGINRLSIGIQSFHEKDLEMMRRSHTASDSVSAIKKAQNLGFNNINIDLIYGLPWQDKSTWEKNLDMALSFGIQHISAYHLTFEPGTVFDHWRKKGRISSIDEEQSIFQMEKLIEKLSLSGYDHYEISNFALPGFISVHNTNYWKQVHYTGIGPSAHSYNGMARRWNIPDNLRYIQSIKNNRDDYFEYENLLKSDLFNEYILTSLRTMWGINIQEIERRFGVDFLDYTMNSAQKFIAGGELTRIDETLKLTRKGIFLADFIIAELMKS